MSLISTLEKQIQSLKRTMKSHNEVLSNLDLETSKAVKNIEITISELDENIKKLQEEFSNESI
jgi:predicted  nucleic acid-binding Zn-ribbon protein